MLNQFLTNIFMMRHNLYNLLFNTIGEGSDILKYKINNYINEFNNIYILYAKEIKKLNGFLILDLSKIKEISTIKELNNKEYTTEEAKRLIINDFNTLYNMNNQVGKYSINISDFTTLNNVLTFSKILNQ